MFRKELPQLQDTATLLLVWKGHYVHIRSDIQGHPGEGAYNAAIGVIEILERADKHPRVYLTGIWHDSKNNKSRIYFVTEPTTYPISESEPPEKEYKSIFSQAKFAAELLAELQPERNFSGCVSQFFYRGDWDLESAEDKFFGEKGIFVGLAELTKAELGIHMDIFSETETMLSHPNKIKILSYPEFKKAPANTSKSRYGIHDSLRWGMDQTQFRELFGNQGNIGGGHI